MLPTQSRKRARSTIEEANNVRARIARQDVPNWISPYTGLIRDVGGIVAEYSGPYCHFLTDEGARCLGEFNRTYDTQEFGDVQCNSYCTSTWTNWLLPLLVQTLPASTRVQLIHRYIAEPLLEGVQFSTQLVDAFYTKVQTSLYIDLGDHLWARLSSDAYLANRSPQQSNSVTQEWNIEIKQRLEPPDEEHILQWFYQKERLYQSVEDRLENPLLLELLIQLDNFLLEQRVPRTNTYDSDDIASRQDTQAAVRKSFVDAISAFKFWLGKTRFDVLFTANAHLELPGLYEENEEDLAALVYPYDDLHDSHNPQVLSTLFTQAVAKVAHLKTISIVKGRERNRVNVFRYFQSWFQV